ncbi:2-polyprenyl-3-methyl-6-methoxy-1,4-benzoquinone monooxygenase [Candidimonas sp. SYP-B2681]|uniref:2-polyprenyl-3-methyl-6-methoxy-1,4-benzoquinone monooxygenase n=1 Tax=Candidimonas sp. SYP-B2681 TaxID=2497686 RepID=UPI000F85B9B9|nr:2-polyprenyl-3-methyl-6-methoxy-1,4-benzoquinone monooxygenase [Candidimonas sp. SYP-B2681]RTZ40649.1 2-polyprenyl-3-methyl-6-methoxy-1,4-benzoquinone monooxygenase [Candidimonas sp. SYP-B2681]
MLKQNTVHTGTSFVRRPSLIDGFLAEAGRAIQVLDGSVHAGRPNPAGKPTIVGGKAIPDLSPTEQRHAAGLMRVNHVGEICAQALYRGQALFCRDAPIKRLLKDAANEEVDHLVWCRQRLGELHSRPSLLNPLWYAGSFSMGVIASRAGVARNLGFMAETERQVEQHLDNHLNELPLRDERSRTIVMQMRDDEINHRTTAENNGAKTLSRLTRWGMRAMSKVMTVTAYRI